MTDPIYGQTSMKSCLGCSRSFEVPRYARQTPSRCPKCRGKAWSRRPPANSYAYGSGWAARARQVLKRDGYRCQLRFGDICIGKASQVDHIVQPEAGGGSDLANLRAVCVRCHRRRTGQQGAAAAKESRERRKRAHQRRAR